MASLTQDRALSTTTQRLFLLLIKIEFNPKLMYFRITCFRSHESKKKEEGKICAWKNGCSWVHLFTSRYLIFFLSFLPWYKIFIQFYRNFRILLVLIFISIYSHHPLELGVWLGAVSYSFSCSSSSSINYYHYRLDLAYFSATSRNLWALKSKILYSHFAMINSPFLRSFPS